MVGYSKRYSTYNHPTKSGFRRLAEFRASVSKKLPASFPSARWSMKRIFAFVLTSLVLLNVARACTH
jgi:hypothetical protein